MRSCWASIWFWSMLILTSLTAPLAALTTFSIAGCNCLHGPHHGAQKSTITGTVREASSTSLANLVWSLSLMRSAGAACGAAPFNIGSMDPRTGGICVARNVASGPRGRKGAGISPKIMHLPRLTGEAGRGKATGMVPESFRSEISETAGEARPLPYPPPMTGEGREEGQRRGEAQRSSTLAAIRWTSSGVKTGIEQAPLAQAKAAASGSSGYSTSAAGNGPSRRSNHSMRK